jgi:hypothetical protein
MLGRYGSDESREKYNELIAPKSETETEPEPETPSPTTVSELIAAYIEHASTYYKKPDGTLTREHEHVCEASKYLRRFAGGTPAEEFGPKML